MNKSIKYIKTKIDEKIQEIKDLQNKNEDTTLEEMQLESLKNMLILENVFGG